MGSLRWSRLPGGFSILPIGAGGWINSIDIANDDTLVGRSDTFGAYRFNAASQLWEQLVTTTSMTLGTDIGLSGTGEYIASGYGVYEIAIAPSNSLQLYMMYNSKLYTSSDRGSSWTLTSFSAGTFGVGGTDNGYRMNSPRMAVHPSNANICVATTPGNGAWYTTDGGSNWTQISGITNPTTSGPGMFVQFDPTNGNTVYIGSDGVGVYLSTTGASGTFSITSSGPTTLQAMHHDIWGRLWVAARSGTNNCWKFESSAWTNVTIGGQGGRCHSFAPSKVSNQKIYIGIDSGDIISSTNGGSSWTQPNFNNTRTAGVADAGWLAQTNETYMSSGRIVMSSTDRLFFSEGIGVWYSDTPGATMVWTSKSQGIEQLVVNRIVSPPSGQIICSTWDRDVFRLDGTSYPANHGINYSQSIMHGWDCDYAKSDPTCIVVHATDNSGVGGGGKSTNGGQTWALFGTQPKTSGSIYGGGIAAATPSSFVVIHGNAPTVPRYTTDGGATWNDSTVTGVTSGWQDVSNSLSRHIITCDNAGVYYAYNSGTSAGIYKSTDGGANFTKVFTGNMPNASSAGADGFNAQLEAVPGASWTGRLVYSSGDWGGSISGDFKRSNDSGVTWTSVPNVVEVKHFGFGSPKPGGSGHPTVFIVGWVSSVYGVWRSDDFDQATPTWTQLSTFPLGRCDFPTTVCGDMNTYNKFYIGYRGSGAIQGAF